MKAPAVVLALGLAGIAALPAAGQDRLPPHLAGIEVPPLDFDPPTPELHEVRGVPVFWLRDTSVPLVSVFASFEGGWGRLGRDWYGAGVALPSLLRYGGTSALSPDSVDTLLEHFAIQTSFGGAGGSVFASMNALSRHADTAVALWGSMLRDPAFDPAQVEVWRGRELESVRRRGDDPGRLAFSEFNRLLYGDHPVGWEMSAGDLEPADVTPERLGALAARIVCPGNLTLGATGDLTWDELRPLIDDLLAGWEGCGEPLPEAPTPDIRRIPGVYVIPRAIDQSVIVMAHPADVRMADSPDYFASQIGNTILGGGGFSSRLLSRVRTEEGYAYSAASLWTNPREYEGLIGAITRTRPERTVDAIGLVLEILEEVRREAPEAREVDTAVDQIVNGFVFNFDSPASIVSRRMFYLARDLPSDWLERYVAGVRDVTPEAVQSVFARHLRPDAMTILVVGDLDRIGRERLERIAPVTILEIDGPPPP